MTDSGADRLREALRARGLDWPAPIEHHDRLSSTSDRLKARARDGAPEWTAVQALEQTAGRGRQGRAWASPAGGVYLSVLLRPRFESLGLIPLAAGVAVAEALGEQGIETELKWPNDVLAAGRKLAGILAEASSSGSGLDWVVLGLGINVAAAVLARLTVWYHALRVEPRAVLRSWREHAAPWWGRRVELHSGGRILRGVAEGVDPGGALLLALDDGTRATVLSGDVTAVRLEPGTAGGS
ncbi:MAG TPA: biotin--[acetyl-CoA-carboxylase] ligase [Vicinamibacteria bacterium]|nr:biotin--[acetyl-CoA-carboxylase] ligase [Vicinamibacteria bacterium]